MPLGMYTHTSNTRHLTCSPPPPLALPKTNLAQILGIRILERLLRLSNLRLQHALESQALCVGREHQIQRLLRGPTRIDQRQGAGLVRRVQTSSVGGKLLGLLTIHDAQDIVEGHLLGVVVGKRQVGECCPAGKERREMVSSESLPWRCAASWPCSTNTATQPRS